MTTMTDAFSVDAARALGGPEWLVARRVAAAERLSAISWPTTEEEIWRYSRIGELDLDRYRPFVEAELGQAGDERAPGGGPWAAEAGKHGRYLWGNAAYAFGAVALRAFAQTGWFADLRGYERVAHLAAVPMPGGMAAIREPWRMAAVWVARAAGRSAVPGALPGLEEATREAVLDLSERDLSPRTTSMGRLFDAVAAVLGVRDRVTYEGQAAVELEQLAGTAAAEPYLQAALSSPVETRR